jgi:SAM-dependent methyltransferase
MDISERAVEIAKCGVYTRETAEYAGKDIFEGVTAEEMDELFDRVGDVVTIKSRIKEGIQWHISDAGGPNVLDALGPQDIVVANNFLCHMGAAAAERCLRNIARLVKPYGHLFVSGVDLDIRTKVAKDLGWRPLRELLKEIHHGDPRMQRDWPWNYSSLEPLNRRRRDWRLRYAAAFELVPSAEKGQSF